MHIYELATVAHEYMLATIAPTITVRRECGGYVVWELSKAGKKQSNHHIHVSDHPKYTTRNARRKSITD